MAPGGFALAVLRCGGHSAGMHRIPFRATLLAVSVLPTAGVAALPPAFVSGVTPGAGPEQRIVEVTILNPGARAEPHAFPDTVPAEVLIDGRRTMATLVRQGAARAAATIAAGGFAQARYALTVPAGGGSGVAAVSLTPGQGSGYAFAVPLAPVAATPAGTAVAGPVETVAVGVAETVSAKPATGNAFLANLSSYGPIYGVYGPGTSSDARIQIGFKYQLFGEAGVVGGASPAVNGVHFGYTQRLFWDLGRKSSPFRNVEYRPEIFYLVPAVAVADRIVIGGQAGLRHESNGRDGLDSRSVNTVYVQPMATTRLGDHVVTVGPRAWFYVGSLEDNPDIKRFRGNTGLFAEIGQADGWRLTTMTNLNPGTGKGSFDALLSYPLDRIVETNLNLYVFGQAFAGYGENLFDYDRRQTRVRVGVGFTR